MKKIVHVGRTDIGNFYAQIGLSSKSERTVLSIVGVERPRRDGNAASCGQNLKCLKAIKKFADGWDKENALRFYSVWDRWHGNDFRPYCEHMIRDHGFDPLEMCTVYHFDLCSNVLIEQRKIEKNLMDSILRGEVVQATQDQLTVLQKPYQYISETAHPKDGYKVSKVETKVAGQLKSQEHSKGLLLKTCPTCAYAYGSRWRVEEIPADVLDFLESLPASINPADWFD